MLLESHSDRQEESTVQEIDPDVSINSLVELLDIFPERGGQ